jgi:hypothetical protein
MKRGAIPSEFGVTMSQITQRIIVKGQRRGMFVSFLDGDKVHIGYSLCSKADKYDNAKALTIAFEKAKACWDSKGIRLAHSIQSDFAKFYDRCERFYKGATFPEIITMKEQDRIAYYGIKHREDIC